MKILINRKPVNGPWGGGNLFLKSFFTTLKDSGHKIITKLEPNIDVIFIMNPRYDQLGISINEALNYKKINPGVKIIQRINDCDARKNTSNVDAMLIECSKYIDATIFVSNWMKKYFMDIGWSCDKNFVLFNGVATTENIAKKIQNNKINLVTHHWSDNYLKGFDVYDFLDNYVKENDKYTFTYIGRERGTFNNTKIISPLSGQNLLFELQKYDVYVSASRFDPGPNHILEAISCGLPMLIHSDGGGTVEFGASKSQENIFKNFDDLIDKLTNQKFQKSCFEVVNWKSSMLQLNNIIEEVVHGQK